MIVRTEAVALRSIAFRETSRIVTLYTRERGRVTVLAKGARLQKSRFGSTLQPMSYTQVVFYAKPERDLQVLTESSHIRLFNRISRDMEKIAAGLRIVELARALLHEEEQDTRAFDLLVDVLRRLDEADGNVEHLCFHFQMRLAGLLGFAPDFDRAILARLSDDGGVLALDTGAILRPEAARSASRTASKEALRAFAVFARADAEHAVAWPLSAAAAREVRGLIADFLRYHVEGAYPQRSERVFRQMQV